MTEEAGPAHASNAARHAARPVIGTTNPDDDAGANAPAAALAASVDQMDFTKWDVIDMASIPLSVQNFSEEGIMQLIPCCSAAAVQLH